jgi:hypothetical protein
MSILTRSLLLSGTCSLLLAGCAAEDGSGPGRGPGGKADNPNADVTCIFEDTFSETLESAKWEVLSEETLEVDAPLSPMQKRQIRRGASLGAREDLPIAEAFDTDDNDYTHFRLRHKSSNREFDAYKTSMGDNPVGFIFESDSLQLAAENGDDSVFNCTAIGELTPDSDVCLIMVRDRLTGRSFGLVEDFDAGCPNTTQFEGSGQGLTINLPRKAMRPVEDETLLTDLQTEVSSFATYHFYDVDLVKEMTVTGDALPKQFGVAVTGGDTEGTAGVMQVHLSGTREFGDRIPDNVLSAALTEGQRLFGNDCDGVPTDQVQRFFKNGSLGSMLEFLRIETTDFEARMSLGEVASLERFLLARGVENLDIYFGRADADVCGGSAKISYNLLWNRDDNIVYYVVMMPTAD